MPDKTFRHSLKIALATAMLIGLAACSEEPPTDITAKDTLVAISSGDGAAWEAVRSKKIRWPGKVTKVFSIDGDDFIKEYYLRYDPGFDAGAIAEAPISASEAEKFKPGQTVTVTAPILSFEKETGMIVVKLGTAKVE